jgi:hypothetical protein
MTARPCPLCTKPMLPKRASSSVASDSIKHITLGPGKNRRHPSRTSSQQRLNSQFSGTPSSIAHRKRGEHCRRCDPGVSCSGRRCHSLELINSGRNAVSHKQHIAVAIPSLGNIGLCVCMIYVVGCDYSTVGFARRNLSTRVAISVSARKHINANRKQVTPDRNRTVAARKA